MRYQIIKVRNGLWRLRWENGKYSEHSTREGAERMALQLRGPSTEDCYLAYDDAPGHLTCTYNHKPGEACLMDEKS